MTAKRPKLRYLAAICALAASAGLGERPAQADMIKDFRFGAALGYGGAGTTADATIDSTTVPVSRSEGPGSMSLYIDYTLDDHFVIAVDHLRGFRLGPFSSETSFTGLTGRWYFGPPVPGWVDTSGEGATLLIRRFAPYLALSTGVALADITREEDQVPEVKSSGIYFGYKVGADYPLGTSTGFRSELGYATTLQSPGAVSELHFLIGLYLYL